MSGRPFVDLHVLRDDTHTLTLYGDDDQAITDPSPALVAQALARLERAIHDCRWELHWRTSRLLDGIRFGDQEIDPTPPHGIIRPDPPHLPDEALYPERDRP